MCGKSVEKIPKMLWNTLGNIEVMVVEVAFSFLRKIYISNLFYSEFLHLVVEGLSVDGK